MLLNNRRLGKSIGMWIGKRCLITNKPKTPTTRQRKRSKKKEHKRQMIALFGRTRWYLSWWLGAWVLYFRNPEISANPEFEKYYDDKSLANKDAKALREKYMKVDIANVYNNQTLSFGYMVCARGKKPEYQKFYRDEAVVNRYAKRLQEKYEKVKITKVFDKHKRQIGFTLNGWDKIEVEAPTNIVNFNDKKALN